MMMFVLPSQYFRLMFFSPWPLIVIDTKITKIDDKMISLNLNSEHEIDESRQKHKG
jgi:hypothetical protein